MSNESSKMWSGRFREPLNKDFERWQRSFPFDWRLIPQEVAASTAHAKTIAAAGILTAAELTGIVEGLRSIGEDFVAGKLDTTSSTPEDVHHFLELELQHRIGTVALKLHTGRSRNEQIATDLRLYVRASIEAAVANLLEEAGYKGEPLRWLTSRRAWARRPCPATHTCSVPNRCWWRIG